METQKQPESQIEKEPIRTTRFGRHRGEEDITIEFSADGHAFSVKGKNIGGRIVQAMDDALAPEIPKGSLLLVDEKTTSIEKDGLFVFDQSVLGGCDIAFVEKLKDGRYRYTSDYKAPKILSDLSSLKLIGRVWEVEGRVPFKTLSGEKTEDGGIKVREVKVSMIWLPIWPREHMFWCHEDKKFSKPAAQRAL